MSSQVAQEVDFLEGVPSKPHAEANPTAGQFVTFTCSNIRYGIDIMSVREIRSWSTLAEMPSQPHGGCGVLDIRGEVVQIFDLSSLLGGMPSSAADGHVILIISISGQNVGILVESVSDIIQVSEKDMREVPSQDRSVVTGMAKHDDVLVSILDLTPLLGR